ncbi:MAG: PEGA domain-containing protein [Kofleriaceae bacterium]|nr:PEGA domain-containing protein [Kofleriaceae bacterium]
MVTPVAAPDQAAADPAAVDPGGAVAADPPLTADEQALLAAPAAAPVTTLVAMTFTSVPPGATVVLIDGGQTTPLGQTPLQFSVEPDKRYEVMYTLEGHASVILPVDPAVATTIAASMVAADGGSPTVVAMPAPAPAAQAAPQVAAAPVAQAEPAVKHDRAPSSHKRASSARSSKRTAAAEPARSSGSSGTLKIGAKPPCDIYVDGKKTGKVTPQAAMKLSAGKHTITLVNKEHKIKEQVRVTIEAGETTKVIKDLTSRM